MHGYDDEEFDEELELATQALAMAEQLVRSASYLCIEPVGSPTAAQLMAVQAFFPEDAALDLRRAIIEGRLRMGPFLPGGVLDYALAQLRSVGLNWRTETPNAQDLAKLGFAAH
jgi:hypothetical protein